MKLYVFDIDGVLADHSHRFHHIDKDPKDWTSYFAEAFADAPIAHGVELLQTLVPPDGHVVFATGRSDECYAATMAWLKEHVTQGRKFMLYMRRQGDHRGDNELKIDFLNSMKAINIEPRIWFEDRSRVVGALRAEGVNVYQTAPGNF